MKKGNIITVHNDSLTQKEFEFHPVWCEYYEPAEIEELTQLGENKEFLYIELVQVVEASDGQDHPFYTLPINAEHPREFLYVSSDIELFGESYNGYAVVVRDEITSFVVFKGSDEFDIYNNDELSADNFLSVQALTGQKIAGQFEITYSLKSPGKLSGNKERLTILSSKEGINS
jgi:hypothetical protein